MISKFLSDNLFLLAEVLSPAVEKIHSTEHSSSGRAGVQMKNWIDFSCDLVFKLSWCQVISFSFDRVSNKRFLFRFSSGKLSN